MRKILVWCSAVLVGMSFLSAGASAQDVLDRDSWIVNAGAWDNDDNWVDDLGELSTTPTLANDRWALVNSGVATVSGDHKTSGLAIGNGTVEIVAGASLEVALRDDNAFSVGQTEINRGGTLRILGDGSYKGLDGNIFGTLEMGQTGSFELSGDANLQGTYNIEVTGAGSSVLKIGGAATVGGTVAPTFTDTSPGFGDTITFVEANTVKLSRPSLELPAGVTLPRGLQASIVADGGKASITFGNLPILQVDRGTADAKIMNVVGDAIEMTGYVIESELGTLEPSGFSGFGGATWDRAAQTTSVAEFSLTETRSVAVDDVLDIGKIYNGGATSPRDEDVTFSFSTPGGDIIEGLVEYIGPANDLVLNLNPETGEATIQNLSAFIDPIEVTGYSVISASDSLKVDEWKSLEKAGQAGWLETNPASNLISELNLSDSTIFSNGTVVSLGNIFDVENGQRDLVLQYTTTTDFLEATVEYQVPMLPPMGIAGDINGDGMVGFPDFLILSANFGMAGTAAEGDIDGDGQVSFPDFLTLSANFGQSAAAVGAAVPEPNSLSVLGLGALLMLASRRRRKEDSTIALGAIS